MHAVPPGLRVGVSSAAVGYASHDGAAGRTACIRHRKRTFVQVLRGGRIVVCPAVVRLIFQGGVDDHSEVIGPRNIDGSDDVDGVGSSLRDRECPRPGRPGAPLVPLPIVLPGSRWMWCPSRASFGLARPTTDAS